MKPKTLISFILAMGLSLFAQYQPSWPSCIQTNADGSITVTWTHAYDPLGSFMQNILLDAEQDTVIYLTNFTTTSAHTYTQVDGNTAIMNFLFENHEFSGNTRDSISNILMTFINNGGSYTLNWNRVPQLENPKYRPYYYIEIEQGGAWSVADSVYKDSAKTYSNTIFNSCNDTLNFRIALVSDSCTSYSNIEGDWLTDLTAPITPELFYVSVDTLSGLTKLEWDVNPSIDTYGYLIRKRDLFGNLQAHDNVIGRTNTVYIDQSSNNDIASEEYEVAAYDYYCLNPVTNQTNNVSAPSKTHKTIFLRYQHNVCERELRLLWNEYINWDNGVESYEILMSDDGPNGFTTIATVDATTFNYLVSDIDPYKSYAFIIKANASGDTKASYSNKIIPDLYYPYITKYIYLSSADVIQEDLIEIRAHIEAEMQFQYAELYAGTDPAYLSLYQTFTDLNNLSYSVNGIVDQEYYFQLRVIDSCGFPTFFSNIAKNSYLEADKEEYEYIHTINWTSYEDWAKGAARIEIERQIGENPWSLLTTVAPDNLVYMDDINDLVQDGTPGRFCYRVKYYEYDSPVAADDYATSNIACVDYEPLFYMANAFKFNGETRYFRPRLTFDKPENYLFEIYNRHGVLIFSTTEVEEGWDGRHEGKDPELNDVYLFHIKFSTYRGTIVEQKGSVVLIK